MTSTNRSGKPGIARIIILACVVVAAVIVRVWHDRQPHAAATPEEAHQRAVSAPNDPEAQLDWGTALHQMHRDDEAEAAFQRAADLAPNDARPLNALAMLALEHRRPEQALDLVRRSLAIAPNDSDIWRYDGFLLQKATRLGDAAQAFRTAVQLNPKDVVAWRQLGVIDFAINQTGAAINDLQRAAALDPSHLDTLVLLGNDALTIGKITEARSAYQQALKVAPDNIDAKLGLARVQLLLGPSSADLEQLYGQIRQIVTQAHTGAAFLALGQCCLQMRKYPEAITALKTAARLDRHLVIAHTYLAQAYAASGQPEAARAETGIYAAAGERATALLRTGPR